ncbi:MAG: class I SAM-dependent methyltransferase [Flavobacteriales bacterium]|nr:class I SAM-dependent methyltransferase [Flavobacteriales bacterium]MCW8911699.1 class I SAM-dependent methyltransferase [Flavobacteriales bacterium]MCW8936958.1 class I SAM-dependent methyltransferase [Flavobacteriales bacterium]MCW8939195.1 class I SAM-dependent methyltransferase [Flavobacteriales bacterium]MCW8968744.1 class I SAM-dependent methyltransferase [Flavobacteriales bacterium]
MDICEAASLEREKINRHPWELARIEVVKSFLTPIIAEKPNAIILDLGCGDVFVAQQLVYQYPKATFHCVDIAFTPEIISTISEPVKNLPISLYSSTQDLNNSISHKVDVVLLLDVIEHIEDEITFFKELSQSGLIDVNTKVIITVPAYQKLFSNHDIYLKHFRRYNIALLNNHLEQAGFKSQQTGYFFISLLLVRIFQKLFQGNKTVDAEKGIGAYQSKGWADTLFVKTLHLDFLIGKFFRIFGIKLPGLSCFSICQQQPS